MRKLFNNVHFIHETLLVLLRCLTLMRALFCPYSDSSDLTRRLAPTKKGERTCKSTVLEVDAASTRSASNASVMLWNFALLTPIFTHLKDARDLKSFVGEAIPSLLAFFAETLGDAWMTPRVPLGTSETFEAVN